MMKKTAFYLSLLVVGMVACTTIDEPLPPIQEQSTTKPSNPSEDSTTNPSNPSEDSTTNPSNPSDNPTIPDIPAETLTAPAQLGSGETDGYRLVWEDLFDDGCLDESTWNVEVNGDGGGNSEMQYYTRKNVLFETHEATLRKCLVLLAKKETYQGKNVTSARLNTQGKKAFKYGKVEAMIQLPNTYKGLWPAFWMMGDDWRTKGWPKCGEIDILEMGQASGFDSQEKASRWINGACHWGPTWENHPFYGPSVLLNNPLQDGKFHLITLIWTPEKVSCYVDYDQPARTQKYFEMNINEPSSDLNSPVHYFHKPFFVIFNLAVGGGFPQIYNINRVTALNAANHYEAKMYIDYIRVYQK